MTGLKIALSGASGFIGSKLRDQLRQAGYRVLPLVRHKPKNSDEIFYDYQASRMDREKLSECHAVIHLAGKNIMSGLWTKSLRQEIYDSRILSTRFIARRMAGLDDGPKILLNASAVGIYGDQKDLKLDESSRFGEDFLAKVCIDWEEATIPAKKSHIRVVNMRFGNVLDHDGGVLKALTPLFKLGLGAKLGTGEQYFPYVTRDELCRQIIFALENASINGPVNMVAKEPITNKEFTDGLAHALGRRAFLNVPSPLLKVLGDQGELLLSSTRVYPRVLLDNDFDFADENIVESLRRIC